MSITRFVLMGGRVIAKSVVDPSKLNIELCQLATQTWKQLYEGSPLAYVQMPSGHSIEVGTGLRRLLGTKNTNELRTLEHSRKTTFYILCGESKLVCQIVGEPVDVFAPDIFGAIAGSFAAAQESLPECLRDTSFDFKGLNHKFRDVAMEIRSASPSYVFHYVDVPAECYMFADCFAIAMLAQ